MGDLLRAYFPRKRRPETKARWCVVQEHYVPHPDIAHPIGIPKNSLLVEVARGVFQFGVVKQPLDSFFRRTVFFQFQVGGRNIFCYPPAGRAKGRKGSPEDSFPQRKLVSKALETLGLGQISFLLGPGFLPGANYVCFWELYPLGKGETSTQTQTINFLGVPG